MDSLSRVGRFFFAIAMVGFGVQYLLYASGAGGPVAGPPWTPGAPLLAWLAGIGFMVAGLCIASGKMTRLAASLLGAALLLRVLVLHAPGLVAHLHDPGKWTTTFEVLALGGGAWILARSVPADRLGASSLDGAFGAMFHVGRFLFAISLVVFGVQHLLYARFIAMLIPAWIPAHLFLAYLTGVAFFGAALCIATKMMARQVEVLLGTMFFLWVVLLHVPRVATDVHKGNEWTSAFIALAMSGVAFVLATKSTDAMIGRHTRR